MGGEVEVAAEEEEEAAEEEEEAAPAAAAAATGEGDRRAATGFTSNRMLCLVSAIRVGPSRGFFSRRVKPGDSE